MDQPVGSEMVLRVLWIWHDGFTHLLPQCLRALAQQKCAWSIPTHILDTIVASCGDYSRVGLPRLLQQPGRPTTMGQEVNLDYLSVRVDADNYVSIILAQDGCTLRAFAQPLHQSENSATALINFCNAQLLPRGHVQTYVVDKASVFICDEFTRFWLVPSTMVPDFVANYNAADSSVIDNTPYTLETGRVYPHHRDSLVEAVLDEALGCTEPTVSLTQVLFPRDEQAAAAVEKARAAQKLSADRYRIDAPMIEIGREVLYMPMGTPGHKFAKDWLGPATLLAHVAPVMHFIYDAALNKRVSGAS
ncbi:hypothetical protein SARC_02058 [Sphaeroforma arctica JP610]|uniref:Uncharacterized protein n=1 Tax=Sphaeroforma arctica JP610 TaxID=667725 RepID=A0A0L0GA17_9EUKA|nr:hypothetical protein SARC_02058 [Sphaeroforma arctica JP610]KNC85754.1 hypothetical protein SARC_02058 [Sphaeroforma arctica JP610]|eukprot:XP_014159656.1 hypothetical protein SARC_02058 [Sphaeroforma arctica JP610]